MISDRKGNGVSALVVSGKASAAASDATHAVHPQ